MNYKKRIIMFILCLALVFTMEGGRLLSLFAVTAEAVENTYSNVLDDLQNDPNFNPDHYPDDSFDHALKLIQIAESVDGELFLYVYQPSGRAQTLIATAVSISLTEGDDFSPDRYPLTLLSTEGVFSKYKVESLVIPEGTEHKYIIPAIYREYYDAVDGEHPYDNTVNEIACSVGQSWTVSYANNSVSYKMDSEDYIIVTSQYMEFIRYSDSQNLWMTEYTDSHFVAFSTDKPIDDLIEVDIKFKYRTLHSFYKETFLPHKEERWEEEIDSGELKRTLTKDELFESNNSIFMPDYEYKRIQSIEDFLKNEGDHLFSETKTALQGKKWVLRFYESNYGTVHTTTSAYDSWRTESTDVTEVVLLRMKFEYAGTVYNLGVVANVQSGDTNPGGESEPEWYEKIMTILALIVIVLVVLVVTGPIKALFDILVSGLKFIISLMLEILQLPFRLLGFGRRKR